MTRVFDAPIETVWNEWTQPAAFADWFGSPTGDVPLESVSMDLRPGGAWRLTMFNGPNRRRIEWRGTYLEVDPPTRLVFNITDAPEGGFLDLVIVALTDLGDGRTEMRVEQRGGGLTPDEYLRAGNGWSKFFDRMTERLAGG